MVRTPDRDRLRAGLTEAGIASGVYYTKPLHLQPVFAHLGHAEGSLPVTERCARECLALPMFPTLAEAAQREVVEAVAALSPIRS
jgi:dTDP-4-amino-4,6-dideoxygalactose transaminase